MHEWWEWDLMVIAWGQSGRKIFKGGCGPQDLFTLEEGWPLGYTIGIDTGLSAPLGTVVV